MTDPVLILEHETSPGVWEDISTRIRRISTKRGRRRAMDRLSAGTMIVTLENSDRAFDPFHAGTTIDGDQAIRLRATRNAVTEHIFNGRIERIIQQYDPPNAATAVVECVDGVAELERQTLASPWVATMKKYATRVWFRFGHNDGTIALDNSGHGRHGYLNGAPSDADGLLVSDDDGAVDFTTGYAIIGPESFPIGTAFGIHLLLDNMPLPVGTPKYLLYSDKFPRGLSIYMDTSGRINVNYTNPATGIQTAFSRTTLSLHGIDYQLFINIEPGQPIKIYREDSDITDYATDVGTGGVITTADYYVIGGETGATIDELFVTDAVIPSATRLDLTLARMGWGAMLISTRLSKVLTSVGWSTANLISDYTDEVLRAVAISDASALEHIRILSESIEGNMFFNREGFIEFIGRTQRDSAPRSTPQAVFSDSGSGFGYRQAGIFALDTALLTNQVTRHIRATELTSEVDVIARDQASVDAHGLRDNTPVSTLDSELSASLDKEYQLAAYRVAHYKDPILSMDALVISPREDPDNLFPEVLGREIGDVVTVERHPQGIGVPIERNVIVEGIEHDIAPKSWTTRYHIDSRNALGFFLFDVTLWDADDWRFSA